MTREIQFVNGHYYLVDDKTGAVTPIELKENSPVPPDDMKQIIKNLMSRLNKYEIH